MQELREKIKKNSIIITGGKMTVITTMIMVDDDNDDYSRLKFYMIFSGWSVLQCNF